MSRVVNFNLPQVEMVEGWGFLAASFSEPTPTIVATQIESEVGILAPIFSLGQQVTLTEAGHDVRFVWPAAPGATSAEVTAASLRITPVATQRSMGELQVRQSGPHYEVTTSNKRVYSLKLTDLRARPPGATEDRTILNGGNLGAWRLVVSIPDGQGGWLPPLHAVDAVSAEGMIPRTLTGASLSNGVLRLPDLVAPKIRLTVASGGRPSDFDPQSFTLGKVEGTETVGVTDLQVTAPDGSVAASFPGELPLGRAPIDVDLRVPLETAMEAKIAAGDAPDVTFKITGGGAINLIVTAASGALLREAPGVVSTTLEGEPVTPTFGGAFPAEAPASASGDLTVRYDRIRLLETVTDAVPPAQGDLRGTIVTDVPALREFPPHALVGRTVRRAGIVGRVPVAGEVHVQLVKAVSGEALGAPGVMQLAASPWIDTHWVELPEHAPIEEPVALSVRAVSGRFFWVVQDHPLARIAIFDPDFQPRPLTLGDVALNVPQGVEKTTLAGYAFAPASFTGQTPALASDLFLKVDIGDLVLRYER